MSEIIQREALLMISSLETNITKCNIYADKKICISLTSITLILSIQYFILVFFDILGGPFEEIVQLISKILVALFFLYALPSVLKRSKVLIVVTYSVSVFIFLLNYLFFYENHSYLTDLLFPVFFMSLPAFIYAASINNWSILKKFMERVGFIIFTIGLILGFLTFYGNVSVGIYSMALSYYMLFPTILFLNKLLEKFSAFKLLLFLSSLMIILTLGSRGAILSLAVFTLFKLIRITKPYTYSAMYYRMFIVGHAILFYINLNEILNYLYNYLLNLGIYSRSIDLFIRGKDVHLSGRDVIYSDTIDAISNNPLLGIGLGGDRRLTYTGYAHNFFLEVISHFGIIFGSIIILIIFTLIFRCLVTRTEENYTMIIIWICLGFVPLMVSSSYLIEINFWILMGLIVNFFRTD